jgi:hypothetical protein
VRLRYTAFHNNLSDGISGCRKKRSNNGYVPVTNVDISVNINWLSKIFFNATITCDSK